MGGHSAELLGDVAFTDELHDFAYGIHVGTRIVVFALDDFRGNEFHLLDEELAVGILLGLRHTDIDEASATIVSGHHDVFGAEVAVHHAIAMHVIQAIAHLGEDALHLFLGERTHTHVFGQ